MIGIVDRDYRTDVPVTADAATYVLKYHEAESFLCHPDVIHALATAIGTVDPVPDTEAILNRIIEFANREKLSTVARRYFASANHRIGVSLANRTLTRITNLETLKTAVASEAESELRKAFETFDENAQRAFVDAEYQRIETAINSRNCDDILQYIPGKELLNSLATMCGCRNSLAVTRAAKKHLNPTSFGAINELKRELQARLSAGGT